MTHWSLTRDDIVERAIAATGLYTFGSDDRWQEGLDRLLDSLERRVLSPNGVTKLEEIIVRALTAKLKVEDWVAQHPSSIETEVEGPVIILGLPRTATTALLNVLGCDPHWRYVRQWEAEQPIPPPDIATEAADERFRAERSWLATDKTYEGKHIHDAGGPVDDGGLLRLSLRNQELGVPALEYTRWWRDCDMEGAYAYHHQMLRLLQSRRPPRRWLIKAPWHNFHLDELVHEYPNARFLVTHRDPARTIPSVCSLVQTAFGVYQSPEDVDSHEIGRFLLEHLHISVHRLMDFRVRRGDDRFFDMDHTAFNADPLTEVGRAYDWLGIPLTSDVRTAMETWAQRNRSGVRGEHRYDAHDFGLTSDEIRDSFRPYTDQFLTV